MTPRKNPGALCGATQASDYIKSGEIDCPEHTPDPLNFQCSRSARPELLADINRRIILRIARHCQISSAHAMTVADLAGIGGWRA